MIKAEQEGSADVADGVELGDPSDTSNPMDTGTVDGGASDGADEAGGTDAGLDAVDGLAADATPTKVCVFGSSTKPYWQWPVGALPSQCVDPTIDGAKADAACDEAGETRCSNREAYLGATVKSSYPDACHRPYLLRCVKQMDGSTKWVEELCRDQFDGPDQSCGGGCVGATSGSLPLCEAYTKGAACCPQSIRVMLSSGPSGKGMMFPRCRPEERGTMQCKPPETAYICQTYQEYLSQPPIANAKRANFINIPQCALDKAPGCSYWFPLNSAGKIPCVAPGMKDCFGPGETKAWFTRKCLMKDGKAFYATTCAEIGQKSCQE